MGSARLAGDAQAALTLRAGPEAGLDVIGARLARGELAEYRLAKPAA